LPVLKLTVAAGRERLGRNAKFTCRLPTKLNVVYLLASRIVNLSAQLLPPVTE